MNDEHDRIDPFADDFREITADTLLFYSPLGDGRTVFNTLDRYNFNFTTYRSRGYEERMTKHYLGPLDVSPSLSKYPDYSFYTFLRETSVSRAEVSVPSFTGGRNSLAGGVVEYGTDASGARPGNSVTLNYAERRYRAGAKAATAGNAGGLHYAAMARYRAGRDARIAGVFSEDIFASAALEKEFAGRRKFSAFVCGGYSQYGGRGWTTEEVFRITGNNQYNPYWGMYGGKVRNSRVRTDVNGVGVLSYTMQAGKGTRLSLDAGYRRGQERRSGLTWFDAQNPAPDHYLYLPGYYADEEAAAAIEKKWREGDTAYTRLNWDKMVHSNTMEGEGPAGFTADERIGDIRHVQVVLRGNTDRGRGASFGYGVRWTHDRMNYYKRMKDLLGGRYIYNYDQYLLGDLYYGDYYRNDMSDPDRKVYVGDRFGYDYDIIRSGLQLYGTGGYRTGRWSLDFSGSLSAVSLQRVGHYEKEIFPGNESYGKSRKYGFTAYDLRLSARYYISPGHHITLSFLAAETEPAYENIFLSPDYCNLAIDAPLNTRIFGGDLAYSVAVLPSLTFELSSYITASARGTEIFRYYDDVYSAYSLLEMSDIGKLNWGVEAGIKADLTGRLQLRIAGAVNSYVYSNDPSVHVRSELGMRTLLTGAKTYLDGYISSPSPQTLLAASLGYSTYSRWRFELSWMYADRRYVRINPMRRTKTVMSLAASPEQLDDFVLQERLPSATMLNLHVSKGFRLLGMDFFAALSVNNLLGRKDIIYGGYEQMRIRVAGSNVDRPNAPFPSRYAYAYPRYCYASLTCNF